MNFGQAIASGFANYIAFSGRASRPEYWFWILFAALGMVVTELLDTAVFVRTPTGLSPLNVVFIVVLLMPSLALEARRLHDTDRSGWWLLLVFSGIGILLLLYWAGQEGTPDRNRFGPNPVANLGVSPSPAA